MPQAVDTHGCPGRRVSLRSRSSVCGTGAFREGICDGDRRHGRVDVRLQSTRPSHDLQRSQEASHQGTATLRHTSIPPLQEFSLDKILRDFGMTMEQFVDLCILLGCDYCPTIKGIGPKKAFDLIAQYKSIENVLENIDQQVRERVGASVLHNGSRSTLHPRAGSSPRQGSSS